jgi:hypothetical protein
LHMIVSVCMTQFLTHCFGTTDAKTLNGGGEKFTFLFFPLQRGAVALLRFYSLLWPAVAV